MKNTLVLCLCCFLAASSTSPQLRELDACVAERHVYQATRQAYIDSLSLKCNDSLPQEVQFDLYGQLFDACRSYDVAAQQQYAEHKLSLALQMHNPFYEQLALLNMSEVHMQASMFHEAIECIDAALSRGEFEELTPYVFFIYRTLYGLMAEFAITDARIAEYRALTDQYRHALLMVHAPESFYYVMVRADQLAAYGQYDQAKELMDSYAQSHSLAPSDEAPWFYTYASVCKGLEDKSAYEYALIRTAQADLKGAVREYKALWELAMLLYEQGDVSRAYRYISCSAEDAQACNARWRSMEVNSIYPMIAATNAELQHRRLIGLWSIIGLSLIIVVLLAILAMMRKAQMRKLAQAREQLRISDQIKAVYIGHYLQVYTMLVDRMDAYRHDLYRMAQDKQMDKLTAALRSKHVMQEQMDAFYADFDEAFLHIFPDYIEKMRQLMRPDWELVLKPGEKLNTDLRVYALIRLGITDSQQIATMLRLAPSTIFNARTRMRSSSRYSKEEFEKMVTTL